MSPHLPTLTLFAGWLTLVAALATAWYGAMHRVYPGYRWWVAAQWTLALALLLPALAPALPPLGEFAAVAWPLLVLQGLRRLHGRLGTRVQPLADAGVLALAAAPLLLDLAGPPATAAHASIGGALACAWLAALAFATPALARTQALRLMAAGAALAAAALALRGLRLGLGAPAPAEMAWWLAAGPALHAALAMLGGLLLPLMVQQRTEHDLREHQRRLRVLANIDPLTRMANRRHFGELAGHALREDGETAAALLMFDIDHFKRINDHLGHAAGDHALRLVARCTQEVLRSNDLAGRRGGDEFVLLLRRTDIDEAMLVAARIVARVQTSSEHERLPPLSLSFGIVATRVDEVLEEALRRADQALYEAKRQGRSRAVSAAGDESEPVFVQSRPLGLMAP